MYLDLEMVLVFSENTFECMAQTTEVYFSSSRSKSQQIWFLVRKGCPPDSQTTIFLLGSHMAFPLSAHGRLESKE